MSDTEKSIAAVTLSIQQMDWTTWNNHLRSPEHQLNKHKAGTS